LRENFAIPRVAIVSSQEVVARGLVAMLADYPDRVIVTAMPGTQSAAKGIHVVVYDSLALRGEREADLIHLVQNTRARVLVLSRDTRPDLRVRAMELGAFAWLPIAVRSADLVDAVELVAHGRPLPTIAHESNLLEGLSEREAEVLTLIAEGLSNEAITRRMYIGENTLKSHIRHVYKKIGVNSRTQAVLWAVAQGLVADVAPRSPAPHL